MYTIELSVWDRIQLDICLPRNAPLGDIKQLLKIADLLALSDSEKKSIDFELVPIMTQRGSATITNWNDEKLRGKEYNSTLEFESADFEKLKECAASRQNWPIDKRSLDLKERLDAAEEH